MLINYGLQGYCHKTKTFSLSLVTEFEKTINVCLKVYTSCHLIPTLTCHQLFQNNSKLSVLNTWWPLSRCNNNSRTLIWTASWLPRPLSRSRRLTGVLLCSNYTNNSFGTLITGRLMGGLPLNRWPLNSRSPDCTVNSLYRRTPL